MPRVCILSPLALAAVALTGVCIGVAWWGVAEGQAGPVVMGAFVGAVCAFVAWGLGREEPGGLILGLDRFWRARHLAAFETDEAAGEVTLLPEPALREDRR